MKDRMLDRVLRSARADSSGKLPHEAVADALQRLAPALYGSERLVLLSAALKRMNLSGF